MTMTHLSRVINRRSRIAAVPVAAVLGLAGLTACGDSAGPEQGEVTTEDLQQLQDQIGALEDRMAVYEGAPVGAGGAPVAADDFWSNEESLIGQQVTVSAAVSDIVTSTDVSSAFRIAGQSGESIPVITTGSAPSLQVDDLVRITGTVTEIQRDTFEEDFGVAEDELFDDPDAFFDGEDGRIAISTGEVEVLQEQAEE